MKQAESDELQQLLVKWKDALVIVEGKNDAQALQQQGFLHVVTLEGKALFEVVELVAATTKECLVLTDLDAHGKQLYARLTKDLNKHGVKINDELRNFLFKHTAVRQIEGLSRMFAESSVNQRFE